MAANSSTAFTISSSQTKQKPTQYVPLARHHTIIICQNLSSNHNLGLAKILKYYNNRVDIWSELSFWFVKINDAVHACSHAHLVFLWGALGSCLKGPASLMLSNAPLGDSSQLKSWKRGFGKILHQRWKISYWLQAARSNQYSEGVKIVTIENHITSQKGFQQRNVWN